MKEKNEIFEKFLENPELLIILERLSNHRTPNWSSPYFEWNVQRN